MLVALRENWKYKLLALVCALALHSYVIGQSTASQPHTLIKQLTLVNTPPNLLIDEKSLPQISITLDGPADDVARIADTSVTASVDLGHARAGQNGSFPIHVTLPPETGGTVSADPQPSVVPLTLQAKSKRRLLISAAEPGSPPAGYAFRTPLITPRRVTIEGAHAAVNSVQQLIIKVDEDTVGTVDDNFPVIALDRDDSPVESLTISPPIAHVRIEMVRIPLSRTLLISPNVVGTPAFPARVSDIQVSPPTLTVTGRSDRLAHVGTINTAAIDVSGVTSDLIRQVACVPPPGLSLVGSGIVTVTVRITAPPVLMPAPILSHEPATSPAPAR